MELNAAKILITGAAGGIGAELARQLNARGARLALAGRRREPLEQLAQGLMLDRTAAAPLVIAADLTADEAPDYIARRAQTHFGGAVDVLINNAAVMEFAPFETLSPESIQRLIATNVTAPLLLTRHLLPAMLARGEGRVCCIGSTLGTLAMPYFSAYSASKFALRGFTEALRRELDGIGVSVLYVAPRSVKPPLNSAAVEYMAKAAGMRVDSPDYIAARVIAALEQDRREVYIGFPERLFVRINALLPGLVDTAIRGQTRRIGEFVRGWVASAHRATGKGRPLPNGSKILRPTT